jgi:hypothetical protein
MKKNSLINFILGFEFTIVLGFFIFVGLFQVIPFPEILIYRGFLLAIISACILTVIESLLISKGRGFEIIVSKVIASTSLNIVFLVLFPVTFERSVSVFLLRELELADSSGMEVQTLEEKFIKGYANDLQAVKRRINEQIASGNIMDNLGKIMITEDGKQFLKLARSINPLFSSDDRILNFQEKQPTTK